MASSGNIALPEYSATYQDNMRSQSNRPGQRPDVALDDIQIALHVHGDNAVASGVFQNSTNGVLPVITQESGPDFRHLNEYRRSDLQVISSFQYLLNTQTVMVTSDLTESHEKDEMLNTFGISSAKPKYPDYSVISVRVASYETFPSVLQTPEDLAKAGFFYGGREDIVYCFFCGQGLRSWDPEDDPWVEHARWSPSCGHLLNIKGHQFARMVQDIFSENKSKDENEKNNRRNFEGPIKTGARITDSKQLLQTVGAESVLWMGYSSAIVQEAIKDLIKANKNGALSTFGATDILEVVLNLEESRKGYGDDKENNPSVPSDNNGKLKDTNEDVESIKAENRQLKDQTICKICLDEKVSIVFLPCGHLCSCGQCAASLGRCAICRESIKGTVKTVLS